MRRPRRNVGCINRNRSFPSTEKDDPVKLWELWMFIKHILTKLADSSYSWIVYDSDYQDVGRGSVGDRGDELWGLQIYFR